MKTHSKDVKTPLDKAIKNMQKVAKDINSRYKETSEDELVIGMNLANC